jgi:hypothetical protein
VACAHAALARRRTSEQMERLRSKRFMMNLRANGW